MTPFSSQSLFSSHTMQHRHAKSLVSVVWHRSLYKDLQLSESDTLVQSRCLYLQTPDCSSKEMRISCSLWDQSFTEESMGILLPSSVKEVKKKTGPILFLL